MLVSTATASKYTKEFSTNFFERFTAISLFSCSYNGVTLQSLLVLIRQISIKQKEA
jgi:hypothetical protein